MTGGWYHTGDAVNVDDGGHLIFMDRLEHMEELSSGVKYAPQYIEGRLRFSPYINQNPPPVHSVGVCFLSP